MNAFATAKAADGLILTSAIMPASKEWNRQPSLLLQSCAPDSARNHNPRRALLLSALLPGAGQVYNGQAWKIPIAYGILGVGGYFIYDNGSNMRTYKKEYLYRVSHDNAFLYEENEEYPTENIYNMYETYNQRFQLSIIVTVALYGLNCLDAFVFGHLFEFDISDDLSLMCQPVLQRDDRGALLPGGGMVLTF